jgi:exonuclease SbcC
MRPHRLQVTAFGAFANTATIDFDALAGGGVFLLHGETGAGKSTLLDALGFALYGRVPGERGTAKRLRSDHAAAELRTEVTLEATLGERRLRITRSPEQARAKKRGTGTTTEQAKVHLEEWTGAGWTSLSSRVGEADQEIADRLGMSAEQFFQVILLPQGEFAGFLRADAERRGELLEKLFDAGRFGKVEDWLAARRREANADCERHRDAIEVQAALVAQLAEIDPPADVPEVVWGTDLIWQHRAAVDNAQRALGAAATTVATARGRAEATRNLAGRQQRRREVLARAADLARGADTVAGLVAEEQQANAAIGLAPLLDAAATAAAAVTGARAAGSAADAHLSAADRIVAHSLAELRAAAGAHERRRGRLTELQSLLDSAITDEAAGAAAQQTAVAARSDAAAAAAHIQSLTVARTGRVEQRDAARLAVTDLPRWTRIAALFADAATAQAHERAARIVVEQLRGQHLDARERWQNQAAVHLEIRRARFDSMVAELAARLTDGDPCPVCGSCDHPVTAALNVDRVGVAPSSVSERGLSSEEERAAAAAEAGREQAERIGRELAAATATADGQATRLADLVAALGTELDVLPEDLPGAAGAAATERDRLRARGVGLEELESEVDELDATLAAAVAERAEAERVAASAVREAGVHLSRAAAARAKLVEHLDGAPDVPTASAAAEAAAVACTAAADARAELTRALADHDHATTRATVVAVEAGFAELTAAAAAVRDEAWRAATAGRIREHREALAVTQTQLADPELDVAINPPADVEGAQTAAEQAAADHERAVAGLAHAKRQVHGLEQKVPALTALLQAVPALEERAAVVRGLADLTAGQGANTKRMTLSAFVLAARLEEIAAVAGQRLLRMTGGRYSLVHTDAGRGAKRAGLGLLARDNWTGVDRDTATLSGGETFLASLALALGLADVVCAESGGTRLDSLFVDEGFGSLDEATLDEVMDTLDGLREGGRLVGIVSHVAELRQRIPTRVHVRKHETGSSLELTA